MWFKIEKSLILGVILLTSCTQTDIGQFAPLPTEAEELHGELFLADDTSLNVYYDLAVLDSFAIFADFYSDSLLQIRPLSHPERCAKVFYKGNGPDEFVQPLFDRAVAPENRQQLGFIDPNSAQLARIACSDSFAVESQRLPEGFPFCTNLNQGEAYTYGFDLDAHDHLFFVWNNANNTVEKEVPFFPEVEGNYSDLALPLLYRNTLCANPAAERVAVGMQLMNLLLFYDAKGEWIGGCRVGDKLDYPKSAGESLDFPEAARHFTHLSGTANRLYALYNGTPDRTASRTLFVLDWKGNCLARYQLSTTLMRIAASPSDRFLLGIHENEEGGSEVWRFELP